MPEQAQPAEDVAVSRSLSSVGPHKLRAEVIHGFGRGSTELGFPTANMQIRWDAEQAYAVVGTQPAASAGVGK